MRLAVVMPAFNQLYVTKQAVESLFAATADPDWCLVFVNDGSTDGTHEYALELKYKYGSKVKYVCHPQNQGVTAAWNAGLSRTDSLYVAIVNNDVLFTSGWETALISALEANPQLAVVSPLSTHGAVPRDWPEGADREPNPAGYVGYMPIVGCCFMCRTALFDEIGMFPEELKIFFSDNWIVLASQAKGYECGYAQDSYIHHHFCTTTSKINQGPHWAHDGDAFKKIAAEIGIPMKPYVQRQGEDWRKLPVTGVK